MRVEVSTIKELTKVKDTWAGTEALANHTAFDCTTIYYINPGKVQIPVQGPPGTPCVIIELHAPYGWKKAIWLAGRNNAMPSLPDYETTDDNLVVAEVIIKCQEPKIIDGVRYENIVRGEYTWFFKVPPDKKTGFLMGASPLSDVSATQNIIREGHFTKKILGDPSLPAAPGVPTLPQFPVTPED